MNKLEIGRKIIHWSAFLLVVFYWLLKEAFNSKMAYLFLIGFLFLFLIYEYLRIVVKLPLPGRQFIRAEEKNRLCGGFYLVLSMIICLAVFDFKIALIAIAMAVFGDTLATLIGQTFGQHIIPGSKREKTYEGTLAELVVDLIIGLIIWPVWTIVLPMAVVATLVEVVTFKIDDNLSIPLLAGLVGQIIIMIE